MTSELLKIILLNALEPSITAADTITHDNTEFVAYEIFKVLLDGQQTDHLFNSNEDALVTHIEAILKELHEHTGADEVIHKLEAELHARFRAE